ncbi:hypothetical protein Dimus_027772 [Dionaea muscipula]
MVGRRGRPWKAVTVRDAAKVDLKVDATSPDQVLGKVAKVDLGEKLQIEGARAEECEDVGLEDITIPRLSGNWVEYDVSEEGKEILAMEGVRRDDVEECKPPVSRVRKEWKPIPTPVGVQDVAGIVKLPAIGESDWRKGDPKVASLNQIEGDVSNQQWQMVEGRNAGRRPIPSPDIQ